MRFHEDVIFKKHGEIYGQNLIEIEGKIVKLHQTESSILDPKMYKPDLIMELEDRIIIFEFQSSIVNTQDKRRFRFYTALFDNVKIKCKKLIEERNWQCKMWSNPRAGLERRHKHLNNGK